MIARLSIAAAGLALLTSCATDLRTRGEPAPAWNIDRARIVFNGRYAGGSDLYLLDRATGTVTPLTGSLSGGRRANAVDYSPAARAYVFQSTRQGDYDIYILAEGDSQAQPFEQHPAFEVLPQWSPDGTEIAFMSTRGVERGELGPFPGHVYVKRRADGRLRQVTKQPLSSSLGPSDWSPEGRSLLIAREIDGSIDVLELDIGSGKERRMTNGPAAEFSATYSDDGLWIAFHSEAEGESHIAVQRTDGTGLRYLTTGPGLRYYPAWSPDGRWVMYTASDDGRQYDLRAVAVHGGEELVILATPEDEREARFLRDSREFQRPVRARP